VADHLLPQRDVRHDQPLSVWPENAPRTARGQDGRARHRVGTASMSCRAAAAFPRWLSSTAAARRATVPCRTCHRVLPVRSGSRKDGRRSPFRTGRRLCLMAGVDASPGPGYRSTGSSLPAV
jgi:hypothetical protein